MQRVNIFLQVHKGLRAALYHCALRLQRTDFANPTETSAVVEKVKEVLMLFNEHAHKEDQFILPAVAVYEPSVSDAFEQEHEADHALSESLHRHLQQLQSQNNNAERRHAGALLQAAFVEFMLFNLAHMAREEGLLNTVLWRYYDDAAIKQIQQQIVRAVAPWHADFFAKWMLRGLNDHEIQQWLIVVQSTAPAIVFETLLQKAKLELPLARFARLQKNLFSEKIPA